MVDEAKVGEPEMEAPATAEDGPSPLEAAEKAADSEIASSKKGADQACSQPGV